MEKIQVKKNSNVIEEVKKDITRQEAEKLSPSELAALAVVSFEYRPFKIYIIKDFNGTTNEFNAFACYNNKVLPNFSYPDYVLNCETLEKYTARIEKEIETKLFNPFDDNFLNFSNYNEFYNKKDFINNSLPYCFDAISAYSIDTDEKAEIYKNYYRGLFSYLFKNKKDCEFVEDLYCHLWQIHRNKLKTDEKYLYNACINEFINHESAIDWDGTAPALDDLGINSLMIKNNPEMQKVINKAYSKVCDSCEW